MAWLNKGVTGGLMTRHFDGFQVPFDRRERNHKSQRIKSKHVGLLIR